MDPLPPIPTPIEQRWREFRIQVLPVLVFICIVAAVVFLWRNYVTPVSIVGNVESVQANVASPQDGLLTELSVDRFGRVTAGQVIGQVLRADPEMVKASLAAIQADLYVLRARMQIDDQRRELNYHGLRVELMQQKVDLAAARARLIQASNDYDRVSVLYKEQVDSASDYDQAKADMEALKAEVNERNELVTSLTGTVKDLEISNEVIMQNPIQNAIKAKETELELSLRPTPLIAPIDGVVSIVYRRLGERVMMGEPIVTISATESEHIVAYMRQPVSSVPALNTDVEVRTRGNQRKAARSKILEIGAQIEPVAPGLLSPDSTRVEMGLPIRIGIPSELKEYLHPGEAVDIHVVNGS